jgi:hypothetical protein
VAPWPSWSRRTRTTGPPRTANGASSFHLHWRLDAADPLVEVAAVLEVVRPPVVDRLYFWALQVSFLDGRGSRGAAHVGLQWNRNHPGGRAVNWGGYDASGSLLAGSASPLPSAPDDPNTRDYPWEPGRPYRLRVSALPSSPGRWQGEVTDLRSGRATAIRHLAAGGDRLGGPMVWSEVFARCDDPSVEVRWSGLRATTAAGDPVVPTALTVSYEAGAAGGCDNTTVAADDLGVVQRTATARLVRAGTMVDLHGRPL